MAVSYPRDLIEPLRVRSCLFELSHLQARNAARGGQIQVVSLGPSVWKMRYETPPLRNAAGMAWEAWLASMRGGLKTFKAWHPLRVYPSAYPNGLSGVTRHSGSSFDGTCTMTATAGPFGVELSGLPSTMLFAPGDMLAYTYGGKRFLHAVTEPAIATAGVVGLSIEPALDNSVSAGSIAVDLVRPWCTAVVDTGTEDVKWQVGRRAVVSFSATQTIG